MTQMELRQFRVCLALANELHFGRTAAPLRVAQSAVSHTIQDLERELGVTLFVRGRRAVTLTQAGERWAASAREAMQVLDRAAQASRQAAARAAGPPGGRRTIVGGHSVPPA